MMTNKCGCYEYFDGWKNIVMASIHSSIVCGLLFITDQMMPYHFKNMESRSYCFKKMDLGHNISKRWISVIIFQKDIVSKRWNLGHNVSKRWILSHNVSKRWILGHIVSKRWILGHVISNALNVL